MQRRPSQARPGDGELVPSSVIEVERAAGHRVERACRLLGVPESAHDDNHPADGQWRPSQREREDAESTAAIATAFDDSRGTAGPTWEGWFDLATVIDISSRRIVGWTTADHLRTDLVEETLCNACGRRCPPVEVIFLDRLTSPRTPGSSSQLELRSLNYTVTASGDPGHEPSRCSAHQGEDGGRNVTCVHPSMAPTERRR